MKWFNFWALPRLIFCTLQDAVMGLCRKKSSTQPWPAIPSSFTKGFGILFFSQYVNTHTPSIFKAMEYPVWASLISWITLSPALVKEQCSSPLWIYSAYFQPDMLQKSSGLDNIWQQRQLIICFLLTTISGGARREFSFILTVISHNYFRVQFTILLMFVFSIII